MDITKISDVLYGSGNLAVDDLQQITIPFRSPLHCDLYYNVATPGDGIRMFVTLDGEKVLSLDAAHRKGEKLEAHGDLSQRLPATTAEIRCYCLVSRRPNAEAGDEAVFQIRSEGTTIIRKTFSTKSILEPFEQVWRLRSI